LPRAGAACFDEMLAASVDANIPLRDADASLAMVSCMGQQMPREVFDPSKQFRSCMQSAESIRPAFLPGFLIYINDLD
jgi:hypothetical protein